MIVFEKVNKKYSNPPNALSDVSFAIQKGEFVTLVGHSGAGKSTIFKMLLAEEEVSKGNILYKGHGIPYFSTNDLLKFRRKIGVIFQDFRLLSKKTVYENLAFAMEALDFSDKKIETDVPYVLELVNLKDKIWSFPNELSGGEKQRVAIARAIINKPELLLADEPTGNLDPTNTYDVISILKQINKLGTTVILATHDQTAVDAIGGRVITITDGRVASDRRDGKYTL